MPLSLEPLLPHLPAWVLVMFRIAGIFLMGPVFGSRVLPARLKLFLALSLSFCVYPVLLTSGTVAAGMVVPFIGKEISLLGLVPVIAAELLIGVVIGFGANMPAYGLQLSGTIIDQQLGLGIAGVFNPDIGEQTGAIAEFLSVIALMLFVIMGGHRVLLATLIGSFAVVPLGGFRVDGHAIDLVVGLMQSMYELALRVAAPILCLLFLETLALGFIARTVPQLNVLSIGFALRIIAGALLLIATIGVMAAVFQDNVLETMNRLAVFFTTR